MLCIKRSRDLQGNLLKLSPMVGAIEHSSISVCLGAKRVTLHGKKKFLLLPLCGPTEFI